MALGAVLSRRRSTCTISLRAAPKRLGLSEPCCLDITGVMKSPQAVIGSAPQLVPHFILAAAHLYTGMIRYLLLLVVQCMHMHTSVSAPIAVTRYCVHFDHAPTSRCTIGACAHVRLGTVWSYLSNCASRILGATRPCSLLVLMHLVPRRLWGTPRLPSRQTRMPWCCGRSICPSWKSNGSCTRAQCRPPGRAPL